MNKNRFAPLFLPFVAMIVLSTFGMVAWTVMMAAIFVAGTVVICTDRLLAELRKQRPQA